MVAEREGISLARRREPAALGQPATSKQLVRVSGMPWSGPSDVLRLSCSVAEIAAGRAASGSRWTKAFSFGWRAATRASWESRSSTGEICLARMSAETSAIDA